MIATRLTYITPTQTTNRAVCPVCHKMVATFHDRTMQLYFTCHQNTAGKWCDRSGKKATK